MLWIDHLRLHVDEQCSLRPSRSFKIQGVCIVFRMIQKKQKMWHWLVALLYCKLIFHLQQVHSKVLSPSVAATCRHCRLSMACAIYLIRACDV